MPDNWKRVNVITIYKKGPKECPEKYRPISFTSVPGKVAETGLLGTITNQNAKQVIGKSQHTFTKGKSCPVN